MSRVLEFMEDKYFVGREGLVITDEIRLLISASAIQLTFGLRDYMITHLHTINVFPRIFYSKLFETHFKGLSTQGGVLSLSWHDFREGYADGHDRLNLGLHELAHALNIDLDEEGNSDQNFANSFERWKERGIEEFRRLKAGEITFLRSYGSRNMHEFFAVCIEHFFELPEEFKRQLPRLYWDLASMLNQDPANVAEDYLYRRYPEEFIPGSGQQSTQTQTIIETLVETGEPYTPSPQLKDFIKQKGIYVAMATTFIGLFFGIPMLTYFWSATVISAGTIILLLFLCGVLGLFQWRFVKHHLDMEYHQFSMYAFAGFGMCFLNLIFLLNHMLHVSTSVKTYEVVSFKKGPYGLEILLQGEGSNSSLERGVEDYIEDHYERIPEAKKVIVTTDRGLFGMEMIEDCRIIN